MVTDAQIDETVKRLADESLRLARPGGVEPDGALMMTALMQILVLLREQRRRIPS
jgi:hypothetical protein